MRILVPVKQVVDPNARVRVRSDGAGMDIEGLKTVANPFDEIAIEEALRMRERGDATRITAVSIGPAGAESVLRGALALGVDAAMRIDTAGEVNSLVAARILATLARELAVDLVLVGKQAIDDDRGQTGPMLSALLDWPLAAFASRIVRDPDGLVVTSEIDTGVQSVRASLPAVVTVDLRLNTPRFASLPMIMKARKAPIEVRASSEFTDGAAAGLKLLRVAEPPPRGGMRFMPSVPELVDALRDENVI